jgi:hypothetical protein
MCAAVSACGGGEGIVVTSDNTPRVLSVEVSPKTVSMQVGQTQSLTASVRVEKAASQSVSWVSSDPARATVSSSGANATITAVAAGGPVTITATSTADLSKSDFATITITGTPVASVTLAPSDTSLAVGETVALRAVARDALGNQLSGRAFAFSSSSAVTATVSNAGVVTAIVPGTVTILATSEGRTGTATIRVRPLDLIAALELRDVAIERFGAVTSAGEGVYLLGGLLADEFQSGDPGAQRNEIDRRGVSATNTLVVAAYKDLHAARAAAQRAREALTLHVEQLSVKDRWAINQMYVLQGYIEVLLGEHFCNGITFSDYDPQSSTPKYGMPETVLEVFARAIQSFTDALQYRQIGTATDSMALEIRNLALIGRARARLSRPGFFSEPTSVLMAAAEADASSSLALQLPFSIAYRHQASTPANAIWRLNNNERRYRIANNEGTVGVDFVSANDSRLPTTGGSAADLSADGTSGIRLQGVWPSASSSIPLASSIEANLIIAEARSRQGNGAGAGAVINVWRSALGLPLFLDFNNGQATANIINRDRAFFTWGTGHRLGDLRRRIRPTQTPGSTVFPSGQFAKGGTYGEDVNFPIVQTDDNNPNFRGCLDRLP